MKYAKIITLLLIFALSLAAPALANKGAVEVSAGYLKGLKLTPQGSEDAPPLHPVITPGFLFRA